MPAINPTFNPAAVMLRTKRTTGPATSPYVSAGPTNYGAEAVRSTGRGPFDQAYRQNLATNAAGTFARPGGVFSFNPTNPATLGGMPTGGGNAPVLGMPADMLTTALGNYGTPPAQPAPPASPKTQPPKFGGWAHGRGFWAGPYHMRIFSE